MREAACTTREALLSHLLDASEPDGVAQEVRNEEPCLCQSQILIRGRV